MLLEFLIILSINYLGVLTEKILHLSIPGTVLGLIFLFILLISKILKLNTIKTVGNYMITNMVVTFIPPSVKLLDVMEKLKDDFFKLILLLVVTTLITMVVTALTVDFLMRRKKNERNHIQ